MSRSAQSAVPIAAVTKGGAVGTPEPRHLVGRKVALRQRNRIVTGLKERLRQQWGAPLH